MIISDDRNFSLKNKKKLNYSSTWNLIQNKVETPNNDLIND